MICKICTLKTAEKQRLNKCRDILCLCFIVKYNSISQIDLQSQHRLSQNPNRLFIIDKLILKFLGIARHLTSQDSFAVCISAPGGSPWRCWLHEHPSEPDLREASQNALCMDSWP